MADDAALPLATRRLGAAAIRLSLVARMQSGERLQRSNLTDSEALVGGALAATAWFEGAARQRR
ncbi:hypothetical protein D3C84_187640 [compost metagenome]